MSNFKIGDKVVCKSVGKMSEPLLGPCPVKGSVYEIDHMEIIEGSLYLGFKEFHYNDGFKHTYFEHVKLDYDFVEEVIEQVTPKIPA